MCILMKKTIIASGPVIIENGKLLVNKDNFYKLPGGTVEEGIEEMEEACCWEVKEEINAEIEIIRPLNPMIVYKNQQTNESMTIVLIHYLAKLKNKKDIKLIYSVKEIAWLDIKDIKKGKYNVGKNILFLISKEDIE